MPLSAVCVVQHGEKDLVVIGSEDTSLLVYSPAVGAQLTRCLLHEDTVTALCAWDDQLLSGARDQTVRTWSARTLQPIDILDGHNAQVTAVGLEDNRAISGADDGQVMCWDLRQGCSTFERMMETRVVSVRLDGFQAMVVDAGGNVKGFDLRSSAETLHQATRQPLASAVGELDYWQILASPDRGVHLWDLALNRKVKTWATPESLLLCCPVGGGGGRDCSKVVGVEPAGRVFVLR